MTSAPSVTDIGLSGMRSANSTSADQPVASAIGTSGTSARCQRAEDREQDGATASRPATSVEHPPPRRRDAVVGLGGEDRQAGQLGAHAGGRVEPVAHALDDAPAGVERHEADAEGQRRRPPVAADHALREVRRHRVQQRLDLLATSRSAPPAKRSGSENAGHSSALPQPRLAV